MISLYLLILVFLGVYSYSQIDLNLTLLQAPVFLRFQNLMIQLGYYNRLLSTQIFVGLLFLLSIFNFYFSKLTLSKKNIVFLIGGVVILGLVSYPAFSHDVFNYIFDARIFTFHHANPYVSTALMFSDDTWTRFMNWTHRTYPYGPIFLPLTIIVYILGFNKFLWTLFLFKFLAVGAYLGCCFVIYKLAKTRGLLLFALNPLVILEAVISSHLDIIMLFFGLLAYYLLLQNRKIVSLFALAVSIGIKYSTVLFLPFFLWKKLDSNRRFQFILVAAYAGAFFQIASREVLPHYFIVPFGFSALSTNRYIILGMLILSFILLFIRYYGFISTGSWTS